MHLTREQVLANKLDLLLDSINAETGEKMTWPVISEELKKRNQGISRTTWQFMKAGTPIAWPSDELLTALAETFSVDPQYLIQESGPIPERVEKELELLKSMRRAKVRNFALRNLGTVDPEALEIILKSLDDGPHAG
jgi:hypothetical protein